MNKSKLFVVIFLASIIIFGPFVIKKLIIKNKIDTEYIEDNKKDDLIISKKQTEKKNISVKKVKVDKSYFDDALFIGDSRTVGIAEYSDLKNATFFADTGMSVYNIFDNKVFVQKIKKKVKLENLLSSQKYNKVYIMLGINELGYNLKQTLKKYKEIIDYIIKYNSDCIIYIQANLHVTSEKSKEDKFVNNSNINKFNNEIAKFSDNNNIFYINVNEYFDDNEGNLRSDYTHDKVHIYAKYYKEWGEWITSQVIKK